MSDFQVLPYLLEEFSQVVMFDCIGFGFSDKPVSIQASFLCKTTFDVMSINEYVSPYMHIQSPEED